MIIRELRVSYHTISDLPVEEVKVSSPSLAVALIRPFLEREASEVFMVLLLDSKSHLLAVHTVARGSLDAAIVHPREVFKAALMGNAAQIITAHNHPSGDPTPSPEDRVLFARLTAAGEVLGVQVGDHLIIGGQGRYWSALEQGGIV